MRDSHGRFLKGCRPHNACEYGDESVDHRGRVVVKVQGQIRRKLKHIHVYEQHHGPVQPGTFVVFVDGDKRNFDINNLVNLTAEELLIANQLGLGSAAKEMRPSILALARLEAKGGFRTSTPGQKQKQRRRIE